LGTKAELAKSWADAGETDAHELVKYITDLRAHRWQDLIGGAGDWPRFCADVLGKSADFIRCLEIGVNVLEDRRASVDDAVEVGRRFEAEPAKRGNPTGNNQYKKKEDLCAAHNSPQMERARKNGVGRQTQVYLDALARDRPDLLKQVNAGELKPKTAARVAGIIKPLSGLEVLKRAWDKASRAERRAFVDQYADELQAFPDSRPPKEK
jgi:hypothetical protein